MKLLLPLAATVALASTAACGHDSVAPMQSIGAAFAAARADTIPQTVHVIPFYNYGKSGYGIGAAGGDGGLVGSASALYGVTGLGGDTKCSTPFYTGSGTGCGIAYRLVPDSSKPEYKLDILHKFHGAPGDGAVSFAPLFADKSGDFYGTTFYGGEYNGGTLFKLHPSSSGYAETIVHSFGYGQDGAYPMGGVIEVKGILYGTTNGGGSYTNQHVCAHGESPNGTCGTVYSVNPTTGKEQVLHSFGQAADGVNPYRSNLVDVNGTLYGTTYQGGQMQFCGTVFSIGTDGSDEHVIHSFLDGKDGCNPLAGVINVNGMLYGTTCCGGAYYHPAHQGTLFSIDLSTGQETVLHSFGSGKDGSEPDAAVIDAQGILYGTTGIGGGTPCQNGIGCGTIFRFTLSPSKRPYKVFYRFKQLTKGVNPSSPLLYSDHAFFGTTVYGGKKGHGTAVKLP